MKKNFIIVILSLISIASLIFGYSQKQKADEQEALAKEYSSILEEKKKQQEIVKRAQKEMIKKTQKQIQKMDNEVETIQKSK